MEEVLGMISLNEVAIEVILITDLVCNLLSHNR
jgi:hypothetical protein